MSYSEPLINQIYRFLLAAGFGVLMALVYELLSVLRILMGDGKKIKFILDVFFCVLFTVLSFFFMLIYNEGEARMNLVVAELTGLLCFNAAFGRYVTAPIVVCAEKTWSKLRKRKNKKNKN